MPTRQSYRVGLVMPSSNVTMETKISALLRAYEVAGGPSSTFHGARMRMKKVTAKALLAMDKEGATCAPSVFGRPPFGGDEVDGAIEGHLRGAVTFDGRAVVEMGAPFLHWLKRCLSRTRINRPDAAAARASLRQLV